MLYLRHGAADGFESERAPIPFPWPERYCDRRRRGGVSRLIRGSRTTTMTADRPEEAERQPCQKDWQRDEDRRGQSPHMRLARPQAATQLGPVQREFEIPEHPE